jgi:hypothetical protein
MSEAKEYERKSRFSLFMPTTSKSSSAAYAETF